MTDPVLHLIAGPNGSGKSTLAHEVLLAATGLPFVNADQIAAEQWPDDPMGHAYDAARIAAEKRDALIEARRSFVTETVFSHRSKIELIEAARASGYLVYLHIVAIPEDLAVARVQSRVAARGHDVPVDKIRGRFQRLWPLLTDAIPLADEAIVYDNTAAASPFRIVARFEHGMLATSTRPPEWLPPVLRSLIEPAPE